MSNALTMVSVSDIERMAVAVAKSKLFGIKTQEEAMALMLVAQAEGLHPAIAARDYHIIQGKPSLKADAMLARFQTAGGSVKWVEYTDTKCSAVISHPQGGSVTVEWTIEMAKKIGLTSNQTWVKYPRQMLRARVISEGIRTVYPGVAVGVYTPEEVQDFDDKPMKDVTPTNQPEGSTTTPRSAYGSAKAMKTKWTEIRDEINKAQTEVELDATKLKYKVDFETFKSIDAQLFDSLITIGIERRRAIEAANPPAEEVYHTEDPVAPLEGDIQLPEFYVRGERNARA